MVDTLIVSDLAHLVFVTKASGVSIASSDIDMWPGILLALNAGCSILHVHTTPGWKTQSHLVRTIPSQAFKNYIQVSI